jgi:hypothetical protein
MMDKDALYKIFNCQLEECHNLREKSSDLIRRVAQLYIVQLTKKATIPLEHRDSVAEDIEQEVVEMYRKKTYGFITLEDYRRTKCSQSKQDKD